MSAPRWVKVFGIALAVVILLVLVLLVAGGLGMGGHGPGRHMPSGGLSDDVSVVSGALT